MIRFGRLAAVLLLLGASIGCGPSLNLSKLQVTDVLSGWYDDGVKDGLNHLLPSISFRLKNTDAVEASRVDLTVGFWQNGADGENDSLEVVGIGKTPVAPGGSSDPILVRAPHGYTIEQPRDEFFTHSQFKDFKVKIFAKRGGSIVPIGEFTIDRRILPHVTETAGRS
jgi:hypothetical protein